MRCFLLNLFLEHRLSHLRRRHLQKQKLRRNCPLSKKEAADSSTRKSRQSKFKASRILTNSPILQGKKLLTIVKVEKLAKIQAKKELFPKNREKNKRKQHALRNDINTSEKDEPSASPSKQTRRPKRAPKAPAVRGPQSIRQMKTNRFIYNELFFSSKSGEKWIK